MNNVVVFSLLLTISISIANASAPVEAPLMEVVAKADHLLVVKVSGVDMIDANGNQLTEPDAMTGPDLGNTIRLIVKVEEVVVTNAATVPDVLYLPLDSWMHYSLGQIQSYYKGVDYTFMAVLMGPDFSPTFPGHFGYHMGYRVYLEEVLKP